MNFSGGEIMVNKVELKFIINAYKSSFDDYKTYICKKSYDDNWTFKMILYDLYKEYSQYKDEYLENVDNDSYSVNAGIVNDNLFAINYKIFGMIPECSMYEYKNIPIKELEKQFGISKTVFEVRLDLEAGGTVGECDGIRFFFHSNENSGHHDAHIHCEYSGEVISISLTNFDILSGRGFSNRKRTKLALDLIELNQENLLKYWNDVVVNGESVKFKMYIPCNW